MARTQGESTALIESAENGHADCVRLLLAAGADKNAADRVRASADIGALTREEIVTYVLPFFF